MQALLEGTYVIQPVADEIFNKIISSFIAGAKSDKIKLSQTIDISDLLLKAVEGKLDKFDYPIFLNLRIFKTLNKGYDPGQSSEIFSDSETKGKGKIVVHFRIPRDVINTLSLKQIKNRYESIFIHELIHAIDLNREGKKVFETDKEKTIDDSTWYKYLSDPRESNALIHQIKKAISSNRKAWLSSNSTNKLMSFLSSKIYLIDNAFEHFVDRQQSANFTKMLLKRMARENLLPPGFVGKYR